MLPAEVEDKLRQLVRSEYWILTSKNSIKERREFATGERYGFCEALVLLGYEHEVANVLRDETFKVKGGKYPEPTKKDWKAARKLERTRRRALLPGSRTGALNREIF